MKVIELLLRISVVLTLLGAAICAVGILGLLIGVILTEVIDKRG